LVRAVEGCTVSASQQVRRAVPRLALQRSDAAAALGMSAEHFDQHVKAHLPVVYSGRLRLYPVEALQRWLDREAVTPGRRIA
jgi:hypothetical protein